jgi:hypothetical protein
MGLLGTRFKPCSPQINFYNTQAIEPVGPDDHQSNRSLPGLFAGANGLVRLKDRLRLQYCFFRLNRRSGPVIKLWLQVCELSPILLPFAAEQIRTMVCTCVAVGFQNV